MIAIERTIKYESDRSPGFGVDLMAVPGCEALKDCIQCGTCSGVCPLSIYMDYTPRQVMELSRSDFKGDVLSSKTIWLCSSCYACTAECPRQIRITDIMYELKQRAIKEKSYPKGLPIPVLAQEFSRMVQANGRITELLLVVRLFLKTDWIAAAKNWRLGVDLFRTGRLALAPERMRHPEELRKILAAADGKPSNGSRP